MDVVALRRQGWTITDIAAAVGRHPDTVAKWLKAGGPPERRQVADTVIDQRWARRIEELLARNPNLLATSVYRLLVAEGFPASYPTLLRHLRVVRGPRRGRTSSATVPIETAPGEEAQADWSDCGDWGERFGLGPMHCFGAILCWSRHRFWWFASSTDRAHSLEGLVRCFEDAGGVPGRVRIDNMGALVARAHPRLVLHPPARVFAAAHGFAFAGCWPGDAARKGKVERPFRELKEALLEELVLDPPASVGELNTRAAAWLATVVDPRPHRVTGEPPADRLDRERLLLGPLPRVRYDTARREPAGSVGCRWWSGTAPATRSRPSLPAGWSSCACRSPQASWRSARAASSWPATRWLLPARPPGPRPTGPRSSGWPLAAADRPATCAR